ncbi:DUF1045 domain-containing protein [Sedimentimonas flavescens]|nr:DUF1045 domain-containing protein [Sedimentimonas flavescens]
MMKMKRYAIYYAPPEGRFAEAAALWLGRDLARGIDVAQPERAAIALETATRTPRKYGFHATIKAPFRLASGQSPDDLAEALAALTGQLAPVTLDGLRFERMAGRFLALRPEGDIAPLNALAAEVVKQLEPQRAPLSTAEIARRSPERLSPRQRDLLERFGYPYVLEEFRFHLTLSGDLDATGISLLEAAARDWFGPVLPAPFIIHDLCLCGEDEAGQFHLLSRHELTG